MTNINQSIGAGEFAQNGFDIIEDETKTGDWVGFVALGDATVEAVSEMGDNLPSTLFPDQSFDGGRYTSITVTGRVKAIRR